MSYNKYLAAPSSKHNVKQQERRAQYNNKRQNKANAREDLSTQVPGAAGGQAVRFQTPMLARKQILIQTAEKWQNNDKNPAHK